MRIKSERPTSVVTADRARPGPYTEGTDMTNSTESIDFQGLRAGRAAAILNADAPDDAGWLDDWGGLHTLDDGHPDSYSHEAVATTDSVTVTLTCECGTWAGSAPADTDEAPAGLFGAWEAHVYKATDRWPADEERDEIGDRLDEGLCAGCGSPCPVGLCEDCHEAGAHVVGPGIAAEADRRSEAGDAAEADRCPCGAPPEVDDEGFKTRWCSYECYLEYDHAWEPFERRAAELAAQLEVVTAERDRLAAETTARSNRKRDLREQLEEATAAVLRQFEHLADQRDDLLDKCEALETVNAALAAEAAQLRVDLSDTRRLVRLVSGSKADFEAAGEAL
jgi:hypothetical protein